MKWPKITRKLQTLHLDASLFALAYYYIYAKMRNIGKVTPLSIMYMIKRTLFAADGALIIGTIIIIIGSVGYYYLEFSIHMFYPRTLNMGMSKISDTCAGVMTINLDVYQFCPIVDLDHSNLVSDCAGTREIDVTLSVRPKAKLFFDMGLTSKPYDTYSMLNDSEWRKCRHFEVTIKDIEFQNISIPWPGESSGLLYYV